MIIGETSLEKLFEYYSDVKREIVIKMLIRCKKLYESRADVKKIMTYIIMKEELFDKRSGVYDIFEKNQKMNKITKGDQEKLNEGLKMISRILSAINHFKEE